MPIVYCNDIDSYCCEWLENLPFDTDVDNRCIADITGADLNGYTQCHFFAGIGGWLEALRLAGIPSTFPVWTGSCPCQPFSVAGNRKGAVDKRHLWPEFRRLIEQCKPPIIFGEQVTSKLGRSWLTGVRTDLEALGYVVGAADLCAASAGAPHIRQRLFWGAFRLADDSGEGLEGWTIEPARKERQAAERGSNVSGLADSEHKRQGARNGEQQEEARVGGDRLAIDGFTGGLADSTSRDAGPEWKQCSGEYGQQPKNGSTSGVQHTASDGRQQRRAESERGIAAKRCSETFWSDREYIYCTDGKHRPIKPGLQPLVNGVSFRLADGRTREKSEVSRVNLLRGIGNAIVPQLGAIFIQSFLEALKGEVPE